jgi:hypothetical protein
MRDLPDDGSAMIGGVDASLVERLEAATGRSAARGRHAYVIVEAESIQRVGLEARDGDLVLLAWPGELKAQAVATYHTHRARRLLDFVAGREGWRLEPRPHLGFRLSSRGERLYTVPTIDVAEYVRRWEAEPLDRVGWPPEAVRPELWPWLLDRGFASAADEPRLEEFLQRLGNRQAHLRPALRLSRRWPLPGPDADELGRAVAELFGALDEPQPPRSNSRTAS